MLTTTLRGRGATVRVTPIGVTPYLLSLSPFLSFWRVLSINSPSAPACLPQTGGSRWRDEAERRWMERVLFDILAVEAGSDPDGCRVRGILYQHVKGRRTVREADIQEERELV